jgi:hypothetical protein
MTCDFETTPTDERYKHTCKRCGYSVETRALKFYRQCKSLPPLAKQITNVTLATLKWVAAGRPIRSKEEQAAILETCKGCEFYMLDKGRCSKCGCYLKQKIKMATEACPVGKW